ncbi:MAG: polysaccharide pyruvyl transferase family protein [Balneolaceae bacterium]
MNILLIGQCSLHWGRMEFGNIGNYYIIEPFIRQLHQTFPGANIKTTFQLSDGFCVRENISVLPMELYYGWNESDLDCALKELSIAELYKSMGKVVSTTSYIDEVLSADLVIDFSGDIWGDNADFLGPNRFLVGLIKDRVAQLLGKPTVMLAGSPGPFDNQDTLEFAKEVFADFDLVTNREPISMEILKEYGFDISKTFSKACPSFLFEPQKEFSFISILDKEGIEDNGRPKAGFILCGWNFTEGPFDKWPREDKDYLKFAESVEYMIDVLGLDVYLMSHSNGFPIPPKEFELQHGRDYPIIKQLQKVLSKRGVQDHVHSIDGVYDTWETKALIGNFDFLVSGRVHGAIAGLSQAIPTVIIDYGHEPKAHKLVGFAKVIDVENYVASPESSDSLKKIIKDCWIHRKVVQKNIANRLNLVHQMTLENFQLTREVFEGH